MTLSEENYLKIIYHLSVFQNAEISTNSIAEKLSTKASSVTDMLKKLADKNFINYQKYQGVSLTEKGLFEAKMIVRKHRLWEVFLVDKLSFSWDEVHDVAEQLEHIKSDKLIEKLDSFLGFPSEDPHGDPIPNQYGEVQKPNNKLLAEAEIDKRYVCVGVKDSSSAFLQYLDKHKIGLGTIMKVVATEPFDNTFELLIDNKSITVSSKIATNIFIS
ncbi:MAG: hypothetical protein RLZZ312_1081 [Bacteroidota bacterium]|jgi:DtxR family Mn-dependent transcriptional regulator